jgi:hypothetical protein
MIAFVKIARGLTCKILGKFNIILAAEGDVVSARATEMGYADRSCPSGYMQTCIPISTFLASLEPEYNL